MRSAGGESDYQLSRSLRPMRIKLTLEYDGTAYSGWQLQAGQDSIQARIEAALQQLFGEKVRLYGAGRTDAGVHALSQVAAFSVPPRFEIDEVHRALNALLPRDIVVRDAVEVGEDFDPRRAARCRVYEYRVLNQNFASPFDYRYCWLVRGSLEQDAMATAARLFVGEHDFAAFRSLGSEVTTTVRHIYYSAWRREGRCLIYRVEGSSFLRHMVRTMVATMVEVGRGKLASDIVPRLLAEGDRAQAPAAAPARGLFLVEVRY
jgi:tRNA pseudouridine38-40 synthase